MTFSTSKIGTIKEVREHLRDHHGPGEAEDRLHRVAVDSALSELDILERAGVTHASASVSGHHYDYPAADRVSTGPGVRRMGVQYSVTVGSAEAPDENALVQQEHGAAFAEADKTGEPIGG